ncbi:hypothetical protein CsatA_026349 [Cannabis sativa]
MSAVSITNVTVLDNPSSFLKPFQFEISYECLTPLKDVLFGLIFWFISDCFGNSSCHVYATGLVFNLNIELYNPDNNQIEGHSGSGIHSVALYLEWKLIYVGSAEDETYDQQLESVLVGPVNVGNYRFVLQADPPDPSKIREEDIIGVTVLLLTGSYLGQEFVRVGYYVNNDYADEQLREEPPTKVLIDKIQRNILCDKPRVTKFPINFHPENSECGEQPLPTDNAVSADGIGETASSHVHHFEEQAPRCLDD